MDFTIEEKDVVIIGAGLTGLTLAYLLRDTNLNIKVIEARKRIGGRIHTLGWDTNHPIEMGATWLGSQHSHLISLLQELNIETFDQHIGDTAIYEAISTSPHYLAQLPANQDPTMRIKGGTESLIQELKSKIKEDNIQLDSRVSSIEKVGDRVLTKTSTGHYISKMIISTLPPNLLLNTISISPDLPNPTVEIAKQTHTWMGESIKVALSYTSPFWKQKNFSGTIMSNVGPIPEMYDHTNYDENFFALKGFLNGNFYSLTKEERLHLILNQLSKYFGSIVRDYLDYEETIWKKEEFTFYPNERHVLPHQNNGHPVYQDHFWDGSLYIGGSETATTNPGYMEGAVQSAMHLKNKIIEHLTKK